MSIGGLWSIGGLCAVQQRDDAGVVVPPPCVEEQSRSGKSCTFESGTGGPHVTEARPAHSRECFPMTPVEWLLVELILAPIVGGLIAYGVVLWFGHGRALDHR
jgi:hypothetical protein